MFQNLGRIYRQRYINNYIKKEMRFIANFYESKNSKIGRQISNKILSIDDELISKMVYLYLMVKQKHFMTHFYTNQTFSREQNKKRAQLLQMQLKRSTAYTFSQVSYLAWQFVEEMSPKRVNLEIPEVPDASQEYKSQARREKDATKNKLMQLLRRKVTAESSNIQYFRDKLRDTQNQIQYIE